MHAINLYYLTRTVNSEYLLPLTKEYEAALSGIKAGKSKKQFKPEEVEQIRLMLDQLLDRVLSFLSDGWFYGFAIPQISKEFDLLRIGEHTIINIELKRKSETVTVKRIKKQLHQNCFYLKFLNRNILSFSLVKDDSGSFLVFKYLNGELTETDFKAFSDELLQAIESDRNCYKGDIESLFDPCSYLISPINMPERFVNKEYFLTNEQSTIKDKILRNEGPCLFGIKGSAGTGKTLLLYDIAVSFDSSKKVCIIHSANLSESHKKLLECLNRSFRGTKTVNLVAAKDTDKLNLEEYQVICVDEAHRMYDDQLDKILEVSGQHNTIVIFSYDYDQCLSKNELTANNPEKLNRIAGFSEFVLKTSIRTNSEILSFIKNMMDLSQVAKSFVPYDNVDVLYANDFVEADNMLSFLRAEGCTFISYTPGRYNRTETLDHYADDLNTHSVIGQEFDHVAVVLGSEFSYNEENKLQAVHPSSYYLFDRLLYQNATRARKRLSIIVINNAEVFEALIHIKNHTLKQQKENR